MSKMQTVGGPSCGCRQCREWRGETLAPEMHKEKPKKEAKVSKTPARRVGT